MHNTKSCILGDVEPVDGLLEMLKENLSPFEWERERK